MCNNENCHLASRTGIAKSNRITVERCGCGQYWLTTTGTVRVATADERALAEVIESLVRLKLPGARTEGR